jgi:aromatic-L-amino-acid/L-tryptophan decarboxylase
LPRDRLARAYPKVAGAPSRPLMSDRSPLDLDHAQMRRLGYQVVDVVAEHLATLRDQRVSSTADRSETRRLIAAPPPEAGTDFDVLLQRLKDKVFPLHTREPHPGFMAYVPSCPTFPAVLGDWLASGFNFFTGVWPIAPGPNEVELLVLDWFRAWLGMPAGTSGLLTSGGSAATLTAVVAARRAALRGKDGEIGRLTLYTSEQAHSSVIRAAWIAGVPRSHVRSIEVDDEFQMRPEQLAAAVTEDRKAGLFPFLVAASAGTTNTGAVDPLHAIADLCAREGMWMHVDAAYAGFAALTSRGRAALAGIERADSVTLDPHKSLFVPFECGCLLAREPRALEEAFHILPEYLRDVAREGAAVNFADCGEQLTRYSRALKVWLSVHYFGIAAIRDTLDRGMDLAAYAEELVRQEPLLEVLAPARFSVVCFRAHPRGVGGAADLDVLNERINERVNAGGRFFMSSTRLRGAFALRLCPLGFRTTKREIAGVIAEIVRLARAKGE